MVVVHLMVLAMLSLCQHTHKNPLMICSVLVGLVDTLRDKTEHEL